jgi:hypothetical protein
VRPDDALAALLEPPADAVRLRTARIDGFTSTAATITLAGGSATDVRYLASYSPGVGHTVLVLQTNGGQLVIIGRVA